MKTFYIETFGCQMNAHDSEKVVGTLLGQGYAQVATPDEAELVFYNTCSIRDKAEQKVFHRLQQFKKRQAKARPSPCWDAWRSRKARRFSRRRRTSAWCAARPATTSCREMLVQLEAGNRRVTGLSLDTDETFDTPLTRRDNPHRAYITIIEGLRQILRLLRGAVHARAGAQPHQRVGDSRKPAELADAGYTEIQLLGQNVNSYRDPSPAGWDFATLLDQVGRVPGIRRVRFTTSHPRDFVKAIIDAIDANPALCNHVHLPVQSGSTRVLDAMQRLYTRDEYMRRIEWMKNARRPIAISTDIIVGFPGETGRISRRRSSCSNEVEYDSIFSFKYSRRPNTAALALDDQIPEEEKTRRLAIVQERQRAIQVRRNAAYVGAVEECLVEGFNKATGQWIGRTSQNKTLNFLKPDAVGQEAGNRETLDPGTPDYRTNPTEHNLLGRYVGVRVTRAGPNSLAGEYAG